MEDLLTIKHITSVWSLIFTQYVLLGKHHIITIMIEDKI